MLYNLKVSTVSLSIGFIIFVCSIATPYTSMFGKHYQEKNDFACCKGDQLVIHHYYTVNFFWFEIAKGFTDENTGKALPGGCNIKCTE